MSYRATAALAVSVFFPLVAALAEVTAADDPLVEQGEVHFAPTAGESRIAERFRLQEHTFAWRAQRLQTITETVEVWDLTFPSPITTPQEPNNTVHAEYYRARRPGPRPAVIVLHILGGDFELSRLFCNALAQHGVAALF